MRMFQGIRVIAGVHILMHSNLHTPLYVYLGYIQ